VDAAGVTPTGGAGGTPALRRYRGLAAREGFPRLRQRLVFLRPLAQLRVLIRAGFIDSPFRRASWPGP
jgi:hypothetical protein